MTRDLLPLLSFLAGASVGIFYGTTFTLWLMKQKRQSVNKETCINTTPPPDEAEAWIDRIEERITHD
jgi:hypothetical protein